MVVRHQVRTPEHSNASQSSSSYLSPVDMKRVSNGDMWQRQYHLGQSQPSYSNSEQQRISWNALSSCRIEWFNDRTSAPPPNPGKVKNKLNSSAEGGFYHRHPTKRAWDGSMQRNWTPVKKNDVDESDASSGLLTLSNGVGEKLYDYT